MRKQSQTRLRLRQCLCFLITQIFSDQEYLSILQMHAKQTIFLCWLLAGEERCVLYQSSEIINVLEKWVGVEV